MLPYKFNHTENELYRTYRSCTTLKTIFRRSIDQLIDDHNLKENFHFSQITRKNKEKDILLGFIRTNGG